MSINQTVLSQQERQWLNERRVSRLSDNREVQIYPMGAERYLSALLQHPEPNRYPIQADVVDKDILIIPGHGNSCFIFAENGAKSVTVYDKDPVTVAWIKAFKKYYRYREYTEATPSPSIGELLSALTQWYPPLLPLPFGTLRKTVFWMIHPNALRRIYIHYMLDLVKQVLAKNTKESFELDKNISFHAGTIDQLAVNKEKSLFDTAFIPYLLGVRNGIEQGDEIVSFIEQLVKLRPQAKILVTPSQGNKEFYLFGKRYFVTTEYSSLQDIPGLASYHQHVDNHWFKTQGLLILGSSKF